MLKKIILFIGLFLLTACQHSPNSIKAWIAPNVQITLPKPVVADPFKNQQLLTITTNGQSYSLMTLLEVSEDSVDLAGLSTFGVKLFSLRYSNNEITVDHLLPITNLPPPQQILLDIMLSYWPQKIWQEQLPLGWKLQDSENKRELFDEQRNLISSITYCNHHASSIRSLNPCQIKNTLFNYEIIIKKLD